MRNNIREGEGEEGGLKREGGLLERGGLTEDLQYIFVMGFRTAYKLRGLYPRGLITRGTLRPLRYI